jgi:curved DNA-binding protein CbpA
VFVTNTINFLLVALAIFVVVKLVSRLMPPPPPAPPERAANRAPGPPPRAEPVAVTEATLRAGLLELLPQARQESLFARLGVPEGATKDLVKKAFLQLARRFHPDRFASPALVDMKETVSEFFTAVNEAYEVLTDDRKRAEYLATAKAGAASAPQGGAGAVDFQKAEACLRTRDFPRARAFLEAAIRTEGRADYKALLAWAFLADPAGKNQERARALVAEAWKDEKCDRARYVAGLLARGEGNDAEAERAFRAALAINPGHADALRELHQLEARRPSRRG